MTGGPTVNTQAQQAEQQNQVQAENYAAKQQQQAIAAVNSWLKSNGPPMQGAAPLQGPNASSPATMGGGVASGGQMPQRPPGGAPMQPPPAGGQPGMRQMQGGGAPQQAPAQGGQAQPPNLTPQQRQQLVAMLSAQRTT